jgi:glycosyltransferase involved in cell wall biosynthesis
MISAKNFPKISIVTPVKNGAATLEKAIKSLIDQNYPNLEYIIIDGASTDGTLDIIKKYEKNISYWQSSDDGSNILAHIAGIKKASGEIIAFLNCDDFYEAETLHKASQAFIDNPELDMASFRFRLIHDGKIINETSIADVTLDKNHVVTMLGMNARFFKKSLFEKYGLPIATDDQGRPFISNDLEFLARFTFKGIKNKIIDYIGYNYMMSEDSLTFSKNPQSQNRLFEDRIFIAKKFLNDDKIEVPKAWKKAFRKWIKKYRSLLTANQINWGNWDKAWKNFRCGVAESGFFAFGFYLIKTLIRSRKNLRSFR